MYHVDSFPDLDINPKVWQEAACDILVSDASWSLLAIIVALYAGRAESHPFLFGHIDCFFICRIIYAIFIVLDE